MSNQKITGKIISLLMDKGFGFIGVEGYEKNIFFHAKDCLGIRFEELQKGDIVSIGEIAEREKGNVARHVSLA